MVRYSEEFAMHTDENLNEMDEYERIDVKDSPLEPYDVIEQHSSELTEELTDSPFDVKERKPQNQKAKLLDGKVYNPKKPITRLLYNDVNLEDSYDMSSFPRGVMTIFNMHTFGGNTELEDYPRDGTSKDANDLRDTFLELGFIVVIHDNPTEKKITRVLQEIEVKYSTLSCFACAILSHGEQDYFYAHDTIVSYKDVFSLLESPFWVGKPKLFFIQACQGDDYMDAIEPDGLDVVDAPLKKVDDMMIALPRQSDFLYAYSTAQGYSSWRNTVQGSWFIQEVCESIHMNAQQLDLSRILTRANNAISQRATVTQDVDTNGKRQIASIVNQLRKDLYFRAPYEFGVDEVDPIFV